MVVNAEIDPTTLSKLFATGPRYCYARRQFRRVLFAHGAFISRALSCRMEFYFYFIFSPSDRRVNTAARSNWFG